MAFVKYVRLPQPLHRKTPIVQVQSTDGSLVLGTIKWHGAWRTFVFWPEGHTLFDRACLTDIAAQCDELKRNRHVPDGET